MRSSRILGAIGAVALIVVAVFASSAPPSPVAPQAIVQSGPTSQLLSCQLMSLPAAESVMRTALTMTPGGGQPNDCMFQNQPGSTPLLEVVVMASNASPTSLSDQYAADANYIAANRSNPQFGHASVAWLNVHAAPQLDGATAAYYEHAPKTGHGLIFLQAGSTTVRIKIEPYNQAQAYAAAAVVLKNLQTIGG